MVAGGVSVKAIVTEPMLQRYFSWKMRCRGGGSGYHHGGEVLCRNFISVCYIEYGMFLYVVQCNATVLQLNWYML